MLLPMALKTLSIFSRMREQQQIVLRLLNAIPNGFLRYLAVLNMFPFSRIKTILADITADEARARGYIKGNEKADEVITLLKRTTDPQTVYKKQKA